MSQAAQARESWADIPPRRPRREPVSWASADELEILGGLGEDRGADWTVLTLERDDADWTSVVGEAHDLLDVDAEWDRANRVAAAPRAARPSAASRAAASRAGAASRDGGRSATGAGDAITERLAVPAVAGGPDASRARPRSSVAGDPGDGRRTVVIRGHATPMRMDAGADRRRPAPRTRDRIGHRPDRVAMWAVMLGLLLIVVATMTAG